MNAGAHCRSMGREGQEGTGISIMIKRTSIRTKMLVIIVVHAVILLFVMYFNYQKLNSLGSSPGLLLSRNYKSIKAAQLIRQYLEEKQNQILETWFLDTSPGQQNLVMDQRISEQLQVCKDNITEKGEEQVVNRLFSDYERYVHWFDEMGGPGDHRIEQGLDKRTYHRLIVLTASLISGLDELVLINEKGMETMEHHTELVAKQALTYSTVLLALAILSASILSFILSSRMSGPLLRLTRTLAATKVGSGDYPEIPVGSKDEIGFLAAEFNTLFQRLKASDEMSADKLTAERLKVREAEETKIRFVADLSHQIKTPMTSLALSIGILSEKLMGQINPRCSQLLETAREDCGRLSSLVNELLNIARMDAMLKPRPKEVLDIEKVVRETLSPLLKQAREKDIQIETNITGPLPPIAIDSLRFPWIISNLVGNAIRYTDRRGRIVLGVEKHGERLYFQCIDNGTGIQEEYLPKIFGRFTQFSEREKKGHVGLGLAIVKEIIEEQGGDITVESTVGKGTTFTFWIPIRSGEDVP
jgi:signal transduction histidine kinase